MACHNNRTTHLTTICQPRIIPLFSHQYLDCDRCMNMFQTETFQFAGKQYSFIDTDIKKKLRRPAFS